LHFQNFPEMICLAEVTSKTRDNILWKIYYDLNLKEEQLVFDCLKQQTFDKAWSQPQIKLRSQNATEWDFVLLVKSCKMWDSRTHLSHDHKIKKSISFFFRHIQNRICHKFAAGVVDGAGHAQQKVNKSCVCTHVTTEFFHYFEYFTISRKSSNKNLW